MSLKTLCRKKSPWLFHLNSGGCNGCDIEIVAALTPRYDAERFGAVLKGSPRHADVIMATGPVTLQFEKRLRTLHAQAPDPKMVIAVGSCACSGGIFYNCYGVKGGIDTTVPVAEYVPGCPPKPEAILYGVVKALAKFDEKPEPKKHEKEDIHVQHQKKEGKIE